MLAITRRTWLSLLIIFSAVVLWIGSYLFCIYYRPAFLTGNDGPGLGYQLAFWPLRHIRASLQEGTSQGSPQVFDSYNPGNGWLYFKSAPKMALANGQEALALGLQEGDTINVTWSRTLETYDDYSYHFQYVARIDRGTTPAKLSPVPVQP